jgi:hypothetical protein
LRPDAQRGESTAPSQSGYILATPQRSVPVKTSTKIGVLATLALTGWLTAASAQAPPVRIRGTIQSFDGQALTVATQSAGPVRLAVSDMTGINGLEAKTQADIGANTFIGATAVKNPAGRWQATEIHIFPEAMRGAGEGHYAWDLPDSSMTNGAVTGNTAGSSGRTLRVKHMDAETDVEVTAATVIVGLTAGDRSLLVPGAAVFVLAVPADAGGTPSAVAILAETNGVKPPM